MTGQSRAVRLGIAALTKAGGGAENLWRYFVTDPAIRPAIDPILIAPLGYRPVDPGALAAARIPIQSLPYDPLAQMRFRLERRVLGTDAASRTLWDAALRQAKVDLLWITIAGMGELDWAVPLAECCQSRRLPYWLNLQHAQEDWFFEDEARTHRARRVVDRASRIFVVSERNRRSLERSLGCSVRNTMRGVNGPSASTVSIGDRLVLEAPPRINGTARLRSLARFDLRFKGQDLLLEALASPRWQQRDWTLSLQGGGQHRALLERLILQLGFASERVTLHERDEDIERTFRATDLLVMPSRSEGSPFALVEALACGRPAVVTSVGGQDELVLDGKTGWVATCVSVAAIDQALERAWTSRERWPVMGAAGRKHVVEGWDLGAAHQALLAALLADCR